MWIPWVFCWYTSDKICWKLETGLKDSSHSLRNWFSTKSTLATTCNLNFCILHCLLFLEYISSNSQDFQVLSEHDSPLGWPRLDYRISRGLRSKKNALPTSRNLTRTNPFPLHQMYRAYIYIYIIYTHTGQPKKTNKLYFIFKRGMFFQAKLRAPMKEHDGGPIVRHLHRGWGKHPRRSVYMKIIYHIP